MLLSGAFVPRFGSSGVQTSQGQVKMMDLSSLPEIPTFTFDPASYVEIFRSSLQYVTTHPEGALFGALVFLVADARQTADTYKKTRDDSIAESGKLTTELQALATKDPARASLEKDLLLNKSLLGSKLVEIEELKVSPNPNPNPNPDPNPNRDPNPNPNPNPNPTLTLTLTQGDTGHRQGRQQSYGRLVSGSVGGRGRQS